jgi:hypothetical protein
MGIIPSEHEFVVILPNGTEHKFKVMLAMIDEDGYQFYDNYNREYITTCSCGEFHPFDLINTQVNFGEIGGLSHNLGVDLDCIARILEARKCKLQRKNCPSVKLNLLLYQDLSVIHELKGTSMDCRLLLRGVQCNCKPKSRIYLDRFTTESDHWIDPAGLVYLKISAFELTACVGHPFFIWKDEKILTSTEEDLW